MQYDRLKPVRKYRSRDFQLTAVLLLINSDSQWKVRLKMKILFLGTAHVCSSDVLLCMKVEQIKVFAPCAFLLIGFLLRLNYAFFQQ